MGWGGTGTTNQGWQLMTGRRGGGMGDGRGELIWRSKREHIRGPEGMLPREKLKFRFPEVARNAYQVILW